MSAWWIAVVPVAIIVYGAIGAILVSAIGAIRGKRLGDRDSDEMVFFWPFVLCVLLLRAGVWLVVRVMGRL